MFDLFGSCYLELDPMTFIYDLDPYPLEIYRTSENERNMSRLLKVIVRQTDIQTRERITNGHSFSIMNMQGIAGELKRAGITQNEVKSGEGYSK